MDKHIRVHRSKTWKSNWLSAINEVIMLNWNVCAVELGDITVHNGAWNIWNNRTTIRVPITFDRLRILAYLVMQTLHQGLNHSKQYHIANFMLAESRGIGLRYV